MGILEIIFADEAHFQLSGSVDVQKLLNMEHKKITRYSLKSTVFEMCYVFDLVCIAVWRNNWTVFLARSGQCYMSYCSWKIYCLARVCSWSFHFLGCWPASASTFMWFHTSGFLVVRLFENAGLYEQACGHRNIAGRELMDYRRVYNNVIENFVKRVLICYI